MNECVSVLIERYKQKSEGEMIKMNNVATVVRFYMNLEGKIGEQLTFFKWKEKH